MSLHYHGSNVIREQLHAIAGGSRNKKVLNRIRRIRGQVEAIERALKGKSSCYDVLQLIAGVRGAINGLMAEVLEDHIRSRVMDPARQPDTRAHATEEIVAVVRSYLK